MRKIVAAGLVVLIAALVPSTAGADRYCDVNNGYSTDRRTAAQRLPKQGVVEITRYSNLRPDYNPRSIEENGTKGYINLNRNGDAYGVADFEVPIVSVWQAPSECTGDYRFGAWGVTPWGQVYTDGTYAPHFGDMNGQRLNQEVRGMAITATGLGYWLFAGDGGIFTFGDARFVGSTGGMGIPAPIVAMASTPTNKGYWMAGTDGSVYNFGDAKSYGSMRGTKLNKPVVGMVPTATGKGYWMVAADGGIFTFGDAVFKGSTGNQRPAAPIVGMVPYGSGYAIVTEDGTVYPFQ